MMDKTVCTPPMEKIIEMIRAMPPDMVCTSLIVSCDPQYISADLNDECVKSRPERIEIVFIKSRP